MAQIISQEIYHSQTGTSNYKIMTWTLGLKKQVLSASLFKSCKKAVPFPLNDVRKWKHI